MIISDLDSTDKYVLHLCGQQNNRPHSNLHTMRGLRVPLLWLGSISIIG